MSIPATTEAPLGRQSLIELWGCATSVLDDAAQIEAALREAAARAGATPVQALLHRFAPVGVSGVLVLRESHLAIHTWPERGYAAVDLFTCGATVDHRAAVAALQAALGADRVEVQEIPRGLIGDSAEGC